MSKVSIGFFDDHPILLEGLVNIFSRFNDFAIVERGASAADVVRAAMTRQLDVIVLDLAMPGDVFDAIATICLERPDTKTIAFTASVGVDTAVRALDAGASGYVIKGSTAEELYSAIHAVLRGETFITQSFATKVISALRDATLRRAAAQAIRLSIREEQIVRLLLRGKTNKEIATRLQISEKTVKHYMSILMQKLSARNRIEVVLAAQRLNPDFGISPEMRRN